MTLTQEFYEVLDEAFPDVEDVLSGTIMPRDLRGGGGRTSLLASSTTIKALASAYHDLRFGKHGRKTPTLVALDASPTSPIWDVRKSPRASKTSPRWTRAQSPGCTPTGRGLESSRRLGPRRPHVQAIFGRWASPLRTTSATKPRPCRRADVEEPERLLRVGSGPRPSQACRSRLIQRERRAFRPEAHPRDPLRSDRSVLGPEADRQDRRQHQVSADRPEEAIFKIADD